MMKRGSNIIRSYMTLEYAFTGIRVQDSYLTPVDWTLTVNLIAPVKKRKVKEWETRLGLAYQKIYFWLDTNLPNIMIVDVSKEDDLFIANLSSNVMMYCPGSSGDDLVIQLLHSKLTSLAKNELMIGEIQLKGSDATLQYTFDCPEGDYTLPTTTEEYYTEGTTRDVTPWWGRDDGFCFEFVRPAETELTDEELFKDIIDPMNEFDRVMTEVTSETHVGLREPAKIVQVEKWKPKTIE
jgi:hypothetical protein